MRSLHLSPVVLLLLAACQAVPPGAVEAVDASSTVVPAEGWTSAADASDSDTASDDWLAGAWWREFGSEELTALVEQGLAGSPDLAAAASSVEAAAASLAAARGADLPQVQAGLNLARARTNFIGLPIPGSSGVVSNTNNNHSVNLNISWELDLWGRMASAERGAVADLEASSLDLIAARQSLAAQILRGALALVDAELNARFAADQLDNYRAQLANTKRVFELGTGAPEALLSARAQVTSAEADVKEARRLVALLETPLAILIGRAPGRNAGFDTEALVASLAGDLPGAPPVGLPAELLARRPDLAALEARARAAQAQAEVARANLYPQLSLTSSVGTSGSELENLLDGDFRVWSLGGNLLAPLFMGGRLEAAEDAAIAGRDAALYAFASRALVAFGEVDSALTNERRMLERVVDLEAHRDQLQELEELTARKHTRGSTPAEARYIARARSLTSARILEVTRIQLLSNRVDLYLALGGGFDSSPPTQE
ncbi:MAG: multidrug efflux system outer membrane protein [Planctomycetota bacterium]|jgi:multidrug efflux system outer membrane protein